MDRAFSPRCLFQHESWGDAPGWYGLRRWRTGILRNIAPITPGWLAAGMTNEQIIEGFPELTLDDIRASLACAADRDRHLAASAA